MLYLVIVEKFTPEGRKNLKKVLGMAKRIRRLAYCPWREI